MTEKESKPQIDEVVEKKEKVAETKKAASEEKKESPTPTEVKSEISKKPVAKTTPKEEKVEETKEASADATPEVKKDVAEKVEAETKPEPENAKEPEAEVLSAIRRHNPLMFDFVLKRTLRVGGTGFGTAPFQTRDFFGKAAGNKIGSSPNQVGRLPL